jgi:hypothetical protein
MSGASRSKKLSVIKDCKDALPRAEATPMMLKREADKGICEPRLVRVFIELLPRVERKQ